MDAFKNHITVLVRRFEDNPALALCIVAVLIALAFAIIVLADNLLHKRKLRKEKEMYTGERNYPSRKKNAG